MVGVLGHVDVVPAGDTGWTYPAYGAEIHDGILQKPNNNLTNLLRIQHDRKWTVI